MKKASIFYASLGTISNVPDIFLGKIEKNNQEISWES